MEHCTILYNNQNKQATEVHITAIQVHVPGFLWLKNEPTALYKVAFIFTFPTDYQQSNNYMDFVSVGIFGGWESYMIYSNLYFKYIQLSVFLWF